MHNPTDQKVGVRVPPGAHTRPGRSGTAQPDRNRPGTRRSDSPEGLPGPSRRWSTGRRRSRLRPRGTGPVTSDDVRGRRAPAFGILVAAGSVGPAAPRHSDHASPEFVKPFQQSDPCLPRRRHGHITATVTRDLSNGRHEGLSTRSTKIRRELPGYLVRERHRTNRQGDIKP